MLEIKTKYCSETDDYNRHVTLCVVDILNVTKGCQPVTGQAAAIATAAAAAAAADAAAATAAAAAAAAADDDDLTPAARWRSSIAPTNPI